MCKKGTYLFYFSLILFYLRSYLKTLNQFCLKVTVSDCSLFYSDDFGLKLALLSNQWQGVVRRAQQRRGIIDGLVNQWQRYTELAEKLRHWLQEIQEPEEQQGGPVALQQARGILDHIQVKNKTSLRFNPLEQDLPSYSHRAKFQTGN